MSCTRGTSPSRPMRIQLLRFQWKGERSLHKTRFWGAVGVAALLLLGIAGWANTNANTKNLEVPGPRIDPFRLADGTPVGKIDDETVRIETSDTVLRRHTA